MSLEDIRADKMTCEEFEHMARKKRYNGYKSFEYLEPGIDYKVFKLAKEINRVESYVVPVTWEQEQKVQEILDNDVVVSVHEHIYITTDDISELLDYKHTGGTGQATKG